MTDCPWEDLEQLKVLQRVEELVEAQGGTCRGAQSLSQDIMTYHKYVTIMSLLKTFLSKFIHNQQIISQCYEYECYIRILENWFLHVLTLRLLTIGYFWII